MRSPCRAPRLPVMARWMMPGEMLIVCPHRRRSECPPPPLPCRVTPVAAALPGASVIRRRGRWRSLRRRISAAVSRNEVCAATGKHGPRVLEPDSGSRQPREIPAPNPCCRTGDCGDRRRRGRAVLAGTFHAAVCRAVADLARRTDVDRRILEPTGTDGAFRHCPSTTQKTRGPGLGPHIGLQALPVRQGLER